MAGVVKGVQQQVQVVSSCPSSNSNSISNSNPRECDAFNTDSHPHPHPLDLDLDLDLNNYSFSAAAAEADVNNKHLLSFNPPSSDDASLQDLIDSELALRISSSATNGDEHEHDGSAAHSVENGDVDGDLERSSTFSEEDSVDSMRPAAAGPVNGLLGDFLEHERSHTESASAASSEAAPLCSGNDFDDLLGSEPADSDFSPNIPNDVDMDGGDADDAADARDDNDNADEATLAEDISLTSDRDRSQEHRRGQSASASPSASPRGSLLDLDPLRPDSPPQHLQHPELAERQQQQQHEQELLLESETESYLFAEPQQTQQQQQPEEPGSLAARGVEVGEAEAEGEGEPQPEQRTVESARAEPEPVPSSQQQQQQQQPVPASADALADATAAAAAEEDEDKQTPLQQQQQQQEQAERTGTGTGTSETEAARQQTGSASPSAEDDDALLLVDVEPLPVPVLEPNPFSSVTESSSNPRESGVNNSMDVFSSASAMPPASVAVAVAASTGASGTGFDDGFETWSTVEDAVAQSEQTRDADGADASVAIDTPDQLDNGVGDCESDSETVSETSEKKTVSKKKKIEGGESTSTKKKTKKNKKSDEKENISVLSYGYGMNGHAENEINSANRVSPSNGYADHTVMEDDLSNVCVKDLKSAYTSLTNTKPAKEASKGIKDIDHDIVYCGPIQNLKESYCSEASRKYNGVQTPNRTERIPVATGISIRELRRSFGDLRNCENSENGVHSSQEEDVPTETKARSLGDLRRLSRDLYRPVNGNNSSCLRKPIHTGVSVKALRASYCSLINLSDSGVSNGRCASSNSDALLSSAPKSSFSKFDQLSKKTVLHVRSVDASKVQKQFNESAAASPEAQSNCKSCGKQVFVMEQIKAEKSVWHKNCFRCKECSKQLTVDTYSSNEGELYCKPHFRELFKPKAVVEDSQEPIRRRKPELIITENQPVELPPDVIRASDKPDLGLEELGNLNVKSRFQVFEKGEEKDSEVEKSPSAVNVKRSPSILSKLAKFQAKGMDVGVTDDSLNGIPYEESDTSSEEEQEEGEGEEENGDIVKSSRKTRERPMSFSKMEDVKSRWESGSTTKEERREERKQEIQSIRSRLFMGKQGKMKEMYEQAVKESEQPAARKGAEIRSEKAKSIKEKFERGETLVSDEEGEDNDKKKLQDEELGVFEAGISKKSRSIFMELDATAAKTTQPVPAARSTSKEDGKKREVLVTRQVSSEVVKASDKIEDVQVETADISSKFKFFETYKAPEKQKKAFRITPPREGQVKGESPEREVYRDPDVVRADDASAEDELQHSMTTSKMLSIFRQMEEKAQKEDVPDGPKPLKCFTPPPDYKPAESGSSEEESSEEEEEDDEEEEEDDGTIRSSYKPEDEFLKAAKEAAKAKTLRAKFEHWEEQENNINTGGGNINPALLESEHESIESTKSLRARFESLKHEAEQPKEKPRPKVNRFV